MKKFLLTLLCGLVSHGAMAEWVKVSGWQGTAMIPYFDPSSIKADGDTVKVQWLFDLAAADSAPNGKPFLSIKGDVEYNCKEDQQRVLGQTLQSKKMGEGEAVASEQKPPKWSYVSPDSAYDLIFAVACKVPTPNWMVVNTDNQSFVSSVDLNSVVKSGQFVQMRAWSYFSTLLNAADCKPYASDKSLKEYDCKTPSSRTLSTASYANREGRGKLSCADTKAGEWSPGFGQEVETKIVTDACKKK